MLKLKNLPVTLQEELRQKVPELKVEICPYTAQEYVRFENRDIEYKSIFESNILLG